MAGLPCSYLACVKRPSLALASPFPSFSSFTTSILAHPRHLTHSDTLSFSLSLSLPPPLPPLTYFDALLCLAVSPYPHPSTHDRSAPHCEFIRVLQPGTSGVYPLSDFGLNSGETLKSIVERARGGLGALGFTWRSAFVLNPFVINPVSGLSKVGVTELALSRQIRTTDDEAMEGFLQRYGVSLSSVHLLNENPFPTGSYTGGGGGNLPVYSSYQPSRDVEGGVSEDDRTFVISSSFSTRTCFASNRGVETLLCASAKNATSMYTNSTSPLPPVEDATFLLLRGRRVVASFDTGENGTACMRGFFGDGPFLLTARASDGGVTIPCQGRLGSPIVMFNATVNAAVGVEVDPFRVEAAEVDVYMTSERDPCV